jgi:hypothetical protein
MRATSRYPTCTVSSASVHPLRDPEHAQRYLATLILRCSYMQCGNPEGKPGELDSERPDLQSTRSSTDILVVFLYVSEGLRIS